LGSRWREDEQKGSCVDDSMTLDGVQLQVLVRFFPRFFCGHLGGKLVHLGFSVLFPRAPAPALAAFSSRNLIQPLGTVSFMSEGPDAADRGPGPEDTVGGEVEAAPPSSSSGSTAHQPQSPPHKPDEATAPQPPRRCIFSEVDKEQFLNSKVREGAHRVCVWMRECVCVGWWGGVQLSFSPSSMTPPRTLPPTLVSFRQPQIFCTCFHGLCVVQCGWVAWPACCIVWGRG
jgi:hypothetical protein